MWPQSVRILREKCCDHEEHQTASTPCEKLVFSLRDWVTTLVDSSMVWTQLRFGHGPTVHGPDCTFQEVRIYIRRLCRIGRAEFF